MMTDERLESVELLVLGGLFDEKIATELIAEIKWQRLELAKDEELIRQLRAELAVFREGMPTQNALLCSADWASQNCDCVDCAMKVATRWIRRIALAEGKP